MATAIEKVGLIALEQIIAWGNAYAQAKGNPSMTAAEAEALIAKTHRETAAISDGWRRSREGQ